VEELRDHVTVGDVAEHLAARREVTRFANVISFSANGRSCFAFASVVRIPSCTKSWAASVDSRSFW